MKRSFTLFAGLFFLFYFQTIGAQTSEFNSLNVVNSNSSENHPLSSLRKITFNDGKMQIHNDNNFVDYELSTLQKLLFVSTSTGIDPTSNDDCEIYYDITTESIYLQGDANINVLVCDLGGRIVKTASFDKVSNSISLAELPKGIYVIIANNKVAKILR